MAPATTSPVRAVGKPGAEGLPSPEALQASVPVTASDAAEHSSEHSSSEVALPGEVVPRAHSSSQTASGTAAAPLSGLPPHQAHVQLEEQEPLRITVDAKERLRWSPALHQRFCQAVAELGGSALAKPKDIVAKMRVVGLTLAHVKSHLQKYRLSEGVTCVPHGARGHAASLRRLQHHLPPLPAIGLSAGGSMDAELTAPAAKRARSSPTALTSPAIMAASSGVWPPLPGLPGGGEALPAFLGGLGASAGALPDAAVPVLLPQPVGLPLPPLPLPGMPAAAEPVLAQPEQPEGIEKLLELAELAAAQHDELHSLEPLASPDLDGLGQQLAASAAAAAAVAPEQQGVLAPEVASRMSGLQEQQAQLKAALAAHAQQHAQLAEQLSVFRRSVAELLSDMPQQALNPTQLQKLQQQQLDAASQPVKSEAEQPHAAAPDSTGGGAFAASAVLQAVAQQSLALGAARTAPDAAEAGAVATPHISSLLALFTSAAHSGTVPASAHLQQLMQQATLLAGAQPLT